MFGVLFAAKLSKINKLKMQGIKITLIDKAKLFNQQ
tara:strand:+ start:255 stop:362 length:108 start_codon:yes stop_codon:yes gene_type:complete